MGMKCKHRKQPTGYVDWHEWADKMRKTHDQKWCDKCKRWAIWSKRWLYDRFSIKYGNSNGIYIFILLGDEII